MGRHSGSTTSQRREQASKRGRHMRMTQDLDLMVRFSVSRDRDREGTGR